MESSGEVSPQDGVTTEAWREKEHVKSCGSWGRERILYAGNMKCKGPEAAAPELRESLMQLEWNYHRERKLWETAVGWVKHREVWEDRDEFFCLLSELWFFFFFLLHGKCIFNRGFEQRRNMIRHGKHFSHDELHSLKVSQGKQMGSIRSWNISTKRIHWSSNTPIPADMT